MRLILVASAGLLACVATPAAARDGAWYVGGDFGAMIVEDVNFDYGLNPSIPGKDGVQVAVDHDYGFDGALFVGYDLGAFRLEAEVAYKRARVDDIETVIALPSSGGGTTPPDLYEDETGGSTTALSFMINGMLDFGNEDGLSGFIGGGPGYARVDYSNLRVFSDGDPFVDDSDSRFAWQVIAGLRAAISDNADVTLRYRFFNVDGLDTLDFRDEEAESRFRSHSILGGITFNFGGPGPQ